MPILILIRFAPLILSFRPLPEKLVAWQVKSSKLTVSVREEEVYE
jgi:hypothetical protein